MRRKAPAYPAFVAANPRLNARAGAPNQPLLSPLCGFSNDAHMAGVRISATSTDSTIAEMIVTENWR